MGKKSKTETAQTRKRIIEVAAKAFRSNGIEATGVAEIMSAAGLTHGGFYRHFESKEQLIAEACASSMELLVAAAEAAADGGDAAFLKHLEAFLSIEYHAEYLGGCPLVTMGSELARADIETRRAASMGYLQIIDVMAKHSRAKGAKLAKEDAIFTVSSMIGAVTMARIMDDPEVSDQILAIAKKRLAETPVAAEKKRVRSKTA
jgi:TetR/AcrR family transcriptional regulator, transcriptional repressor for nem operon